MAIKKSKAPQRLTLSARVRQLAEEMAAHPGLDEEQRIELYKRKHDGKRLIDLAFEMEAIGRVDDYLATLRKYSQAEWNALRLHLIPAMMEDQGIENLTVEDLGRLGLTADLYVSIKSGKKEEFFTWLNKHKLGDLIQDSVNPSTLKSFVKGRMDAGKEIPGDLLNVTPFTRASITKA